MKSVKLLSLAIFLTTGQRDNNTPFPFLDPPLHLIRLKSIQNIQLNLFGL